MMRAVLALIDELNEHDLRVLARDAKEFPESKIFPVKIKEKIYNISLDLCAPTDLLPIEFSQTLDRIMLAIKYDIEAYKLFKKTEQEEQGEVFILADEVAEYRHKQFEVILKDKNKAYIENLLSKLMSFVTVLQMLVENFPENQKIKHQCKHLIDIHMQVSPFYIQRLKTDKKLEIEEYEKKVCAEVPSIVKQMLALLKQELTCNTDKKIKNIISHKLKALITIGAQFLFLTNENVSDIANDADTELGHAYRSLTGERKIQGELLLQTFKAIIPPNLDATIQQKPIDENEPRLLARNVILVERKKIILNNHLQYLWNKIHKLKDADKSQIGKIPETFEVITYVGDEDTKKNHLMNKFNIFNELKGDLENRRLYQSEKLSIFNNNLKKNRDVLIDHRDNGIKKSARSVGDFFATWVGKHKILSKSEETILALEEHEMIKMS